MTTGLARLAGPAKRKKANAHPIKRRCAVLQVRDIALEHKEAISPAGHPARLSSNVSHHVVADAGIGWRLRALRTGANRKRGRARH